MSTTFGILKEEYRDLAGNERALLNDEVKLSDFPHHHHSEDDWHDGILFELVASSGMYGVSWESGIAYLLPDHTPVFALDNDSDIKTIGELRKQIDG